MLFTLQFYNNHLNKVNRKIKVLEESEVCKKTTV